MKNDYSKVQLVFDFHFLERWYTYLFFIYRSELFHSKTERDSKLYCLTDNHHIIAIAIIISYPALG